MYDTIVIGAGPAGMTAALYAEMCIRDSSSSDIDRRLFFTIFAEFIIFRKVTPMVWTSRASITPLNVLGL